MKVQAKSAMRRLRPRDQGRTAVLMRGSERSGWKCKQDLRKAADKGLLGFPKHSKHDSLLLA